MDLILAPSINDARGKAILAIVDQRLKTLDLTPLLVYRTDALPDSAVLAMAWQWDVLEPGWALGVVSKESIDALTNIDTLTNIDRLTSPLSAAVPSDYDSYRGLIKIAVPLHQIRGTPGAIIKALAALGFTSGQTTLSGSGPGFGAGTQTYSWGVTLLEGQNSWGGSSWPSNQGWAVFRVVIALAAGQTVSALQQSQIIAAANFWKNARSWLDSVVFNNYPIGDSAPKPTDYLGFTDAAPDPTDSFVATGTPLTDQYAITPLHDAHYYHGISATYGANQVEVADSGVVDPLGRAISANG